MNDLPDGPGAERAPPPDIGTLAYRYAFQRPSGKGCYSPSAAVVVRVLSAEDRGPGAAALAVHQAAGATGSEVRVGHLRGRRRHTPTYPRHGDPHRARDLLGAGGAPDLRGCDAGGCRRGGTTACWEAGIRHIVALRGDAPPGETYQPHPNGYPYAVDLVAGLKRIAPFEISVAAYPEVHPQATSRMNDLDNLKRKLDVGASRAITNFFFDTAVYLRYLDLCLAAGITAPVVPGIMPVTNLAGLRRMSALSGASIPDWLRHMFEGLDDDPETRRMVGAIVAAEQVRLLQANGVDEFHFYTLNRPELTYAIAHILGVRPLAAE